MAWLRCVRESRLLALPAVCVSTSFSSFLYCVVALVAAVTAELYSFSPSSTIRAPTLLNDIRFSLQVHQGLLLFLFPEDLPLHTDIMQLLPLRIDIQVLAEIHVCELIFPVSDLQPAQYDPRKIYSEVFFVVRFFCVGFGGFFLSKALMNSSCRRFPSSDGGMSASRMRSSGVRSKGSCLMAMPSATIM